MRLSLAVTLAAFATTLAAQQITIRAGVLLDGKGGQTRNTTIVIEGGKIVKVDPSIRNATYDLSRLTVMPGWIDTHTHFATHFDRKTGRAVTVRDPKESAELAMAHALESLSNGSVILALATQSADRPIPTSSYSPSSVS